MHTRISQKVWRMKGQTDLMSRSIWHDQIIRTQKKLQMKMLYLVKDQNTINLNIEKRSCNGVWKKYKYLITMHLNDMNNGI